MDNITFFKHGVPILLIVLGLHLSGKAQNAGDFYITTGWMYLAPQSNSTAISLVQSGGTAMSTELPGTAVRLGKSNTLGISGGYLFSDRWALEFTAGIPPQFKIKGWGSLESFGHIAKTTAWTPILQAKYRQPLTRLLRANLSVGATYCWFTGSKIENQQLEQMLGGPTGLEISGAFRPVFSGGLSYSLSKNWFIGGTFSYIPMGVTGTLNTQNQSSGNTDVYKLGVDLNPLLTYLSVGYVFKKPVKKTR
ncbi:MAG: hypothetical protein K0R59_230 [Sphingobacterium sp.]|jgi:outer membrane protein|nr:hypothetical protein [Sphingobacterium sp.]